MKNTKIVLINPPIQIKEIAGSLEEIANIIPPLGIGYIGAVLKKDGFDVKIVDCIPLKLTKEKLGEILKETNPNIISFTATILTIGHAIKTAKYLRSIFPEKIFVIGGPHFTSLPEKTMKESDFDFGILGEGENTFLEFVNMIEQKKKNFSKIKSLVWRKYGEIVINPRREFIKNLDNLPYPARELFPPLEYYQPMPGGYKRLPFGHMVTSRGCPYRCTFCDRSVFGEKFRARSAKNVADEIEFLIKEYGIKEIKFYDDLFTADKSRVMEICDEIIKRKINISWSCSSRVNTVDFEMLKKMKEAGCWQIDYGIESGNQEVLNKMRKGITLKQSEQAVEWTKKAGIKARAFIIIGMPGETKESIDDTINFVKKLPLDVVAFYAVMIYPGNELYETIKKQGKLIHEDFSQYSSLIDVENTKLHYVPEGLTEDYVKKSIQRAYKEFYLRPGYIIRQALSIRSITDIKRYWQAFKTILGM
ncbi:MAG: radical SAM protein [Nanoarchaeota archaeon]|nr:B12-binding domain-containing radical SAM protein [Nanoarchaeota archaeon]